MAEQGKTVTCEVWLLVDEEGNYIADADADRLAERYDEEIGEGAACARRMVRLLVEVELPREIVLTGTAPLPAQAARLTVA